MAYTADKQEFAQLMAQEGMTADAVLEVLDRANRAQRYAVTACNWGLTPRQEANDQRNDTAIRTIVSRFPGFGVRFQGDPRGAVVKITVPSGRTNDWGQTGICVPTRNY